MQIAYLHTQNWPRIVTRKRHLTSLLHQRWRTYIHTPTFLTVAQRRESWSQAAYLQTIRPQQSSSEYRHRMLMRLIRRDTVKLNSWADMPSLILKQALWASSPVMMLEKFLIHRWTVNRLNRFMSVLSLRDHLQTQFTCMSFVCSSPRIQYL